MDAFGIQGSKCLISSFSLNLLTREYSPEVVSLMWSPVDAGGRGLDNTGSYSNYKWIWDLHSKGSVSFLESASLPDPPNLIYYRDWEAGQGGPRALERRKAWGIHQNRRPRTHVRTCRPLYCRKTPHTCWIHFYLPSHHCVSKMEKRLVMRIMCAQGFSTIMFIYKE